MRRASRVLVVVGAALMASCSVTSRTATSQTAIAPTPSTAVQEETKIAPYETLPVVVAFQTARIGFAVESVEVAVTPDENDARILRTDNGGRSWALVWQHEGAELTTVTTVGGRILAAGYLMSSASGAFAAPLLVSSIDGGKHWAVQHPKVLDDTLAVRLDGAPFLGGRLVFLDAAVGFVLPAQQDADSNTPMRTTDGGRTWTAFRVGGEQPDAIAFVTRSHWIATTEGTRCAGRLWSTTDAGVSWSPIPATCERFPLTSISFPTATTGYAAGGSSQEADAFPERAVLTTRDAGRTWRVTWERGNGAEGAAAGSGPFDSITFVTPDLGYVLAGTCVPGGPVPCGGPLWRTTNGGATWTQTRFDGYELDPVGPHDLWLLRQAPGGAEIPEVSTDAASTFTPRPLPIPVSFLP